MAGTEFSDKAITPRTILAPLEALAPLPPDICIYHFLTTRYYHRSFYVGTDMKPFVPSGSGDYAPVRLMSVPHLLADRHSDIDVAFIQVSQPDDNDYVSLGASIDITMWCVLIVPPGGIRNGQTNL